MRAEVAGMVVVVGLRRGAGARVEGGVVDEAGGAVNLDAVGDHQVVAVAIGAAVAGVGRVVVHFWVGAGRADAVVEPG